MATNAKQDDFGSVNRVATLRAYSCEKLAAFTRLVPQLSQIHHSHNIAQI
jgi:hypothetical protein